MPRSLSFPVPLQRDDRLSRLHLVGPLVVPVSRPVAELAEASEPPRNRLLAALPASDFAHVRPHLERVELQHREVLHGPGAAIRHVYFPETAVVSLVSILRGGGTVEVGTAGREGMAGLSVFLADDTSRLQAFAQIAGVAARMETGIFLRLARVPGALQRLLLRYTQAFLTQVAQTAACNGSHTVEERCARWLLMTHDRVEGEGFELTLEFLAFMLGVQRAGVSVALRALQDDGLVRYGRGRMTIVDREGLEGASCECYRVVREHFERLLPLAPSTAADRMRRGDAVPAGGSE